jgi:hypothetical protein
VNGSSGLEDLFLKKKIINSFNKTGISDMKDGRKRTKN